MSTPTLSGPSKLKRLALPGIRLVLESVRRRWKIAVGFAAIGIFLGVVLSQKLGKSTWEATGVMLYSPPPLPDSAKGLYNPPDLLTILPLAKSPEVLGKVRDEFELTVPLTLLEKLFKITAPRGTQGVTVTLQWGDAEMARAMVSRLMDRYADSIQGMRQQKVSKYLDDFEVRRNACASRRKVAMEAMDSLLRLANITDLSNEVEVTRKSIDTYHTNRTYALRDEAAYAAQRVRMLEELENFKKKDLEDAEANKQYDAEMESVSDARRRQDRLRELIEDERQKVAWQAELTVKRKEYDRMRELKEKGATSNKEVDEAKKEVDILTFKLNDNSKVTGWKEELTKIDQAVVPKGKGKSGGSPIIQQALFRKLELDLMLTGIQKQFDNAETGLTKARSRLAELQEIERRSNTIRREIESSDSEREKLSEQIGLFTRLRDQTASEFTVVAPAATGPIPISSNRKLFVLGFSFGGILLGIAAALALHRFSGGHQSWNRLRMPEISSLGEMNGASLISQRLVASHFRDGIPGYGASVLVVGDGSGADVLPWVIRLSRRLAARDERILIVDARLSETQDPHTTAMTGLGEYLHWECDDLNNLIINDEFAGVELLPAGLVGEIDMLASHRMRELIASVTERYSTVFLIGTTEFRSDVYDLLHRMSVATISMMTRDASPSYLRSLKAQLVKVPLWSISTQFFGEFADEPRAESNSAGPRTKRDWPKQSPIPALVAVSEANATSTSAK